LPTPPSHQEPEDEDERQADGDGDAAERQSFLAVRHLVDARLEAADP
jgi:hypothetical protein